MTCRIGTATILTVAALAGVACGGPTNIVVRQQAPEVVAEPVELHVALVLEPDFVNYVARPDSNTSIDFGRAQADLLANAFSGLFTEVDVVNSREEVRQPTQLVITPSVREVQISSPNESYLNVFEVWIKYNLDIESADGEPIDSWFLPAYGKTSDSMLVSRTEGIEQAAVVAIRDAGAKLLLDFFRIPAVYGWMEQHKNREAQP